MKEQINFLKIKKIKSNKRERNKQTDRETGPPGGPLF
jgi:hypothetical protein